MKLLKWINKNQGNHEIRYPIQMIEKDVKKFFVNLESWQVKSVEQLVALINVKQGYLIANAFNIPLNSISDLKKICTKAIGKNRFEHISSLRLPISADKSGLKTAPERLGFTHKDYVTNSAPIYPSPVLPFTEFRISESELGAVFDQGERGTCTCAALKRLFHYCIGVNVSVEYVYGMMKYLFDRTSKTDGGLLHWVVETLESVGWITEDELPYNPKVIKNNPGHLPLGGSEERQRQLIALGKSNKIPKEAFVMMDPEAHQSHIEVLSGQNVWDIPAPVEIGLTLFESSLMAAYVSGGYMTEPLPSEYPIGGHALLNIGWEPCNKKNGFVILANSWGPSLSVLFCPYNEYYRYYLH
jgi:hypothetical protein